MSKRLQKLRTENNKLLCRLIRQRERLLTQLSRVHINLMKVRGKEVQFLKAYATLSNGKRPRRPARPTGSNNPLDDILPSLLRRVFKDGAHQ